MRTLIAAVSALSLLLAAQPAIAGSKVLNNFRPYAQDSYHAYPGLWYLYYDDTLGLGRKAVEQVDYVSRITVDKASFPRKSVLEWRVPDEKSGRGVYGYLSLAYGRFAGSVVPHKVEASRVRDIAELKVAIGYAYSGDRSFNLLNEMFLLAEPDDHETRLFEVGLFAHTQPDGIDFFGRARQLGKYRDPAGRLWAVAVMDGKVPYIMFMPATFEDISGTFDWRDMLHYLIEAEVISGAEWFQGLAVGVEPVGGAGRLTMRQFEVTYRTEGTKTAALP